MKHDSQMLSNSSANARCASVLLRDRNAITKALISGATEPRKNWGEEPEQVFAERVADELDMLISHLEGKPGFGALYQGARMFALFRRERSSDENLAISSKSVKEDRDILSAYLTPLVIPEELEKFKLEYDAVTSGLTSRPSQHIRTLFVGDCLTVEIASFLMGPLISEGISIDPYPINSREPSQFRRILDALPSQGNDVIFVSPFSHARLPELETLLDLKAIGISKHKLDGLIASILEQTEALLDSLVSRFECPIYIHNAAMIPRAGNVVKSVISNLATGSSLAYARNRINQWLSDYVAAQNSSTFRHLYILDENALGEQFGRRELGRYLHTSNFQHATVFSQKLAFEYYQRIRVVAQMMGKKVVICDLDNTLWDGLIGEGAVSHFADRQKTLKNLKENGGVVLSIASKNDPKNVHFEGAVLSEQDFVAPQISWKPKSSAIGTIKSTLNLQTKHMVFLDDRSDERALVQEAFPDMLVLDATAPDVWRRMELWAELAYGSSDLDRTRMYHEQAARDAATSGIAEPDRGVDVEALKKLGLVITVREAAKSDLKRVVELINRTNQWNLCGSRTNFEQVRDWQSSNSASILLASAADKFGDMGVVCATVVTYDDIRADIPLMVLSCRVFGYGVETAMLNEIARRLEIGEQRKMLVGLHRPNNQNHPCQTMYFDHNFVEEDGIRVWRGDPKLPSVPWAEIRAL